MKGLDKIIERIETESGAECSAVAEAALAETERIKAEYEAKAADAEAEIAERTEREAEAVITRAKSSAAMTRRSVISGERSKNVERAYDKAKESLLSLPRDKYAALSRGGRGCKAPYGGRRRPPREIRRNCRPRVV